MIIIYKHSHDLQTAIFEDVIWKVLIFWHTADCDS